MYIVANMALFSFKANNQKKRQTYLLQSLVMKKLTETFYVFKQP